MRPLAAAILLSLPLPAAAQARVQLALEGAIHRSGGARLEVEVRFGAAGAEVRQAALVGHLAEGTTAAEAVALVASVLEAHGASIRGARPEAPGPRGSLFLDSARSIRVRAGHGLQASLAALDDAPDALRLLPPSIERDGARVTLGATRVRGADGELGRVDVELDVEPGWNASQIADRLSTAAIRAGWQAERTAGDAWRLVPAIDGARLAGCAVSLRSGSDWSLELVLAERR